MSPSCDPGAGIAALRPHPNGSGEPLRGPAAGPGLAPGSRFTCGAGVNPDAARMPPYFGSGKPGVGGLIGFGGCFGFFFSRLLRSWPLGMDVLDWKVVRTL